TIDYSGRGTILFGEPDGSESPRARRVADALAAAGVPYELRRDILVAAWEKLAWNAGFNAVTTLTRRTVAEVLAEPASLDVRVEVEVTVNRTFVALLARLDPAARPAT